MGKLYLFCTICALVLTSGCQRKPIEMTSNLTPGQYKITYFDIQPGTPEMATDSEYLDVRSRIITALQKTLPYHGTPPEVGLKLTLTGVNTSINPGQAILVGDHYYIRSFIQLWDIQTKKQLAKTTIYTSGTSVAGIGGLAGHAIAYSAMDLENQLIDNYIRDLIEQLYPSKQNSSANNSAKRFLVGK